jgi:hypothetical protein
MGCEAAIAREHYLGITICLFSLLKPYLRVFRGVSKTNLPGYVGFFQSEIGLRTPGVNPGVKARSRRLQVFVRRF